VANVRPLEHRGWNTPEAYFDNFASRREQARGVHKLHVVAAGRETHLYAT